MRSPSFDENDVHADELSINRTYFNSHRMFVFSLLTLFVGCQEGYSACKNTSETLWKPVANPSWLKQLVCVCVCVYVCEQLYSLTHSLTADGRSDLHNERSRVANWQALMGRPISSSTCWSQVLSGRPGGRFQSAAGGVPVKASMDRCRACDGGVSLDNRQMWPKSEWRRSAMREDRSCKSYNNCNM